MDHGRPGLFERLGRFAAHHAVLVIVFWLAVAGGGNLLIPQLEKVIEQHSAAFIPESNPANQALQRMSRDFDKPGSSAVGYFVLGGDHDFGPREQAYYDELVHRLNSDAKHVGYLMDLQSTPETRDYAFSADHKATTLMVMLNGGAGTTAATQATAAVREIAGSIPKPAGLEVHFSGPAATTADEFKAIERSLLVITAVSVALIGAALLFAYRRMYTVAVANAVLGLGLAVSRPVVAALGSAGVLPMSMFTAALMTAVIIGAGTDYAVFIIGRFHENRRAGQSLDDAISHAVGATASVVIASGLTIATACLAMQFTEVGIFRTAGPPIAVGIPLTLALALTLTPALMSLLGRNGRTDPVPASGRTERRWRRQAIRVVRRPVAAFALCLLILLPLVGATLLYKPNYDDFRAQPASSDSNQGYALAAKHYPRKELAPDFLIVRSDHDMRNSRDFTALEAIASQVAHVDGIQQVRSIARPDGNPIPEGALGYQAGIVANGLQLASAQLAAREPDLQRLADGSQALAGGAEVAHSRMPQLVAGTNQLVGTTRQMLGLLESVSAELGGMSHLQDTARNVAGQLRSIAELARSLPAGIDVGNQLSQLSEQLQQASAMLESAGSVQGATSRLGQLTDGMNQLDAGLGQLADGTRRLADGTQQLPGTIGRLSDGLAQATGFLTAMRDNASSGPGAGFYLPQQAFSDPRFTVGERYFMSPDGHTARMIVYTDRDVLSPEAFDRVVAVRTAAESARAGTVLAGSDIELTGYSSLYRDLAQEVDNDFLLVFIVAIAAVTLILIVMLRSLIAPVVIMIWTVVSFLAATGIGVLVWQELLGIALHWSVIPIAFVFLVGVGADYSMLVIKRIRDESAGHGLERGLVRALGKTGRVITTAGIVFAMTVFALMAGGLYPLAQNGFIVGVGLLLDIVVVRTVAVPATLTLIGEAAWWPAKTVRPHPSVASPFKQQRGIQHEESRTS